MAYLFSLGECLALLSYCFRRVLYIRATSILASLVYIQYSLIKHLPQIFYWSILYILVNCFHIFLLIMDKMPVYLPQHLQQLKKTFFSQISLKEFHRLIKLSHTGTAQFDYLIKKNETINRLIYLTRGQVFLQLENTQVNLNDNHFLGEMSYFSEGKANVDVYVKEKVEFIYWEYNDLQRLESKNLSLFLKVVEAMGKDMMLKVLIQNRQLKS